MSRQKADRRWWSYGARCAVAGLPLLFGMVQAQAQAIPAATSTASAGDLLQLDSTAEQPYTLGRGDSLLISVEGRPELTGKQVIGPDGDVTMPLIGPVHIAEKTREDAAALIAQALLRYYTHPVVTVSVDAYTSNRVLLLGAVERPGVEIFDHPPTLLEVLVRGGAPTRPGSLSAGGYGAGAGAGGFGGNASAYRDALPERCTIYRGRNTAINLDIRKMVETGSPFVTLRLQRDDVVYVPANADRYVSVMGQVQKPGSLPLLRDTTLARVLADAGGFTNQAGRNPRIRIVDPTTGTTREVDFKDLLKPNATEIALHSGDIVYVPMNGFNGVTYALDRLSPLISIFTTAALLNQQ